MKTPREFLLAHHRHVEPKLDAVRRQALSTLSQPRSSVKPTAPLRRASGLWPSLIALVRQARWHFAGMSALWLVAAWLGTLNDSPPSTIAMAKTKTPVPDQIMASLRENRRQVSELLSPTPNEAKPVAAPAALPGGRRSERRSAWPVVAALV